MSNNTGPLKQRLATYGIYAKKGLGQNFLHDRSYVRQIVEAAELAPGDVVVEIGPGPATLTYDLAEAVRPGGKVVAVEVDERLQKLLGDVQQQCPEVTVLWQDALQVDYGAVTAPYRTGDTFALVANLPYYITTPILMHLLEGNFPVSHLVLMVQKEVAERILASPGTKNYGALSVAVQYRCRGRMVAIVPPGAFVPAPKVSSAVIRLDRRAEPAVTVQNEAVFFRVVAAAFQQRRKTLLNALGVLAGDRTKETLHNQLHACGIDPVRRGETLTLEEFARVADLFV
ncbi:16S rRNA (adenine(1518)-N(6)/adenine(1519)-N(6))-dimethyltransferase RsmA [Heliophilum fasciatum]|uniref:Ribosomal RNA small subunit methyltransferase A n=1 Tax=Heliophilum fasciatum TaxID=35700 RepID=A0A4V6NRS9_9FIRM|nr:16S rRNA (adenine(1518)-N(6)/adenine(1519)-N(6))-dimethyltransferase RsmA [Heliophilum fasciatum]MCW2277008.1 16S rRNA (adenine1518-N6/adenine1519-N6)-dimethyltransferase [Heliophilum fasciatum]TCP68466.1 16S rRNA (adenine1518-N6/adenine1519-N6)-dimethyltransferase [Heliophilum fasciatum]